jgi:hypothetical protein
MSSLVGWCIRVQVKTAEADIGSTWEMAPVVGSGDYIFKTPEEARKYAVDEYGESRQWRIVPVTDVDVHNEP